jgi:glutathione S-transferase
MLSGYTSIERGRRMIAQFPLTALASLTALAVYFVAGLLVGMARQKYNVKAPATVGDPAFERAFRAQQNVLEWMPLFLPALWLFAFAVSDIWAAALGFLWAAARIGYIFAYGAAAEKRAPYFFAQVAVVVTLWIGALIGTLRVLV